MANVLRKPEPFTPFNSFENFGYDPDTLGKFLNQSRNSEFCPKISRDIEEAICGQAFRFESCPKMLEVSVFDD
jgi:hypothetical protein